MSLYNPSQLIELFMAKKALKKSFSHGKDHAESKLNMVALGKIMSQQMLSLFCQLERNDKNGEKIEYGTMTHKTVYDSLMKLQKMGFIEGLPDKDSLEGCKAVEKTLLGEKLLLGNFNELGQKRQFYNLTFKLTDKQITADDAKKFLRGAYDKYNVSVDKDGNLKGIKLNMKSAIKDSWSALKTKMFAKKEEINKNEVRTNDRTDNDKTNNSREANDRINNDRKSKDLRDMIRGGNPSTYEARAVAAANEYEATKKEPQVGEHAFGDISR